MTQGELPASGPPPEGAEKKKGLKKALSKVRGAGVVASNTAVLKPCLQQFPWAP